MEAIKIKSPKQITINPMHVRCVSIEKTVDNTFLAISMVNGEDIYITDKIMENYDYVVHCIESIK